MPLFGLTCIKCRMVLVGGLVLDAGDVCGVRNGAAHEAGRGVTRWLASVMSGRISHPKEDVMHETDVETLPAAVQHSPLPWHVSYGITGTDDDDAVVGVASTNGFIVADMLGSANPTLSVKRDAELAVANGEFIARAVNAYADLLAACRLYIATYARTQTHPTVAQEAECMNAAEAAIAKAEGRS